MLRCLLLVPFVVSLWGCTDGRERVVVYSPHGKELLSAYEDAFEAQHPEVDVQWLDMGAQDVYERIRTERGNPQASLWWGAPQTTFGRAAAEGLLASYRPGWAGAVPASARDSLDRWYGTYLTPEGILYNTETISADEVPQDWDDLLDLRRQDGLLIRSPLASGTMRTIFSAMILRQPTVEDGFRWLARLDAVTKSYAADPTQLYLKVARGEGDLTLWNLPDAYLQAKENGYPFGFHIPTSGTPVLVDAIALVKGGPNPERAKQFYDFVTTQEALIRQARDFFRIPARTDIPRDSLPNWMAQQDIREMDLNWSRLAANEADWMQRWSEQVKGRGVAYLEAHPPRDDGEVIP